MVFVCDGTYSLGIAVSGEALCKAKGGNRIIACLNNFILIFGVKCSDYKR